MPGWTRFKPAQEWLQRNGLASGVTIAELHEEFERFLDQLPDAERPRPRERGPLFRDFLRRTKPQQLGEHTPR